jgi:hypothetical protein
VVSALAPLLRFVPSVPLRPAALAAAARPSAAAALSVALGAADPPLPLRPVRRHVSHLLFSPVMPIALLLARFTVEDALFRSTKKARNNLRASLSLFPEQSRFEQLDLRQTTTRCSHGL